MNNTKYLYVKCDPENVQGDDLEFAEIGEDLFESEEITNKAYETYLAMITKGWRANSETTSKKEFNMSDIGLTYKIGPYMPCVKRLSYTRQIDLKSDGMPGIRVTANLLPGDISANLIRPFTPPRHVSFLKKPLKTYKYIAFYKGENKELESFIMYFGIGVSGEIISSINSQIFHGKPWLVHGGNQLYPALSMNAWADQRYLWLANTSEDIGFGSNFPLRLRLGLSKEHIKSIFYARSLPVTETGRKRPILHWVRSHQRRIREGVDIDVSTHLRGVFAFEMDGLRFEITQPNKEMLRGAEPETISDAFRLYA